MGMWKERTPEPKAFQSIRVIINLWNIYAKKKNPLKNKNKKQPEGFQL